MSIFPKRTLRGSQVTIHWNFNTASLTETHIVPYVRIGVRAPDGQLTMLHDGHLLRLPGLPAETPPVAVVAQTLPKSVPLLVLADYLSGRQQRAALGHQHCLTRHRGQRRRNGRDHPARQPHIAQPPVDLRTPDQHGGTRSG